MKYCITSVFCAVLAASAVKVQAVEPGIYDASGTLRFVVTADGAVATLAGEGLVDVGSWRHEIVGGKKCLVFRTWRWEVFSPLAPEKIWVAEDVGGNFRGFGFSYESVEDALAKFSKLQERGLAAADFKRNETVFLPDLEKRVNAAAAEIQAKVKAYEELVELSRLPERLLQNPEELLKVTPEYPKLDLDEDQPGPEGMIALYPPRMHKVMEAIGASGAKFPEKTLVAFLDKIDWEKGDVLAISVLLNREITPSTRQRYAPKVLARIGKSDDRLTAAFFADERTPVDVVKAAKGKEGCGPRTAAAIKERLAIQDHSGL